MDEFRITRHPLAEPDIRLETNTEANMNCVISKPVWRSLLIVLLVPPMLLGVAGCYIKQEAEKTRQTARNVKQKLDALQVRGAVDFESQQMLQAVFAAYKQFLEKRNRPPESWSDLSQAPGLTSSQRVHIREAKKQLQGIVWGAGLEASTTAAGDGGKPQPMKLAWFKNSLMNNMVVLLSDGQMTLVDEQELDQIPDAS